MMRHVLLLLAATILCGCGQNRQSVANTRVDNGRQSTESGQPRQIRVESVQSTTAPASEVAVPGKIEPNPGALSKVALPVAGRITRVMVTVGDSVRRGTPVLVVDSPDTGTAISNYRQAIAKVTQTKSELAKAEADLSRIQDLFSRGAVAQKDVLSAQAQLAQAQSDIAQAQATQEEATRKLRIFGIEPTSKNDGVFVPAPVSGKVLDLSVAAGEYRNDTSAPVMTIADLSTVSMSADMPETSIRLIHIGQQVQIKLDAYPDGKVTGRIARIGDTVDPTTRTIKVRVSVPNPVEKFRPEMFGQLLIEGSPREVITVPVGAVVQTPNSPVVYRERGSGQYDPAPVTLGDRMGDRIAILSGLKKSDRIVTDGSMLAKGTPQ
jgi:cobalt-zinc-cadmium efflux system membrane fusion protein